MSEARRLRFVSLSAKENKFAVVGGAQGKISLSSLASSGYSYDGFHWAVSDLPIKYYINENGTPDIAGTAEEFAGVQKSFQAWKDDSGSYMDYMYLGTTNRNGLQQDGFNVVSWQSIDGPGGTLAETYFWYNPVSKLIFEFDMVFDEDEAWSASGEVGKFDIQNVGTHEAGHTLVLNDLYDPADGEETMYGYSYPGETKKRDLYTGDIAGIRFIYGYTTTIYTIDTNPTGLQVEVDGVNYTTPYSFSWFSGSEHVVKAVAPQNQDAGMRYVFKKWSDNGSSTHSIRVGSSGISLIADYTRQYQTSIIFKTSDDVRELYPTRIRLSGGPENNTAIILESYSNVWLDDVQWTVTEIQWEGTNIIPLMLPTTRISRDFEWTVNARVYPVSFDKSFKDNNGLSLPSNPTSFKLKFPNETISGTLSPSNSYYLQNGTSEWYSIIWQNSEVVPSNVTFDSTDGYPAANCLVYDLMIRIVDFLNLPVCGASVSFTLPNETKISVSTGLNGVASLRLIAQGEYIARISYIGQTSTIKGNVAESAAHPARTQIVFSLPVILLILVPAVLVCLVLLMVTRSRKADLA